MPQLDEKGRRRINLPDPNPATRQAHRQDVLRQLTFPLIISVLVLSGVVAWLVSSGIGSAERWSQIATVFLVLPALLLGFVVLILAAGLVIGVGQMLKVLPPYTRMVQNAIERLNRQVRAGAEISVKPLITIRSYLAMIEALFGGQTE